VAKIHRTLKQRELQAREDVFKKLLAQKPADIPDIHPDVSGIYQRKVDRLTEALNAPEDRNEAAEAIRALVEKNIFRGRRAGLAKILWHDGIGMSLYAKRLDQVHLALGVIRRGVDLSGPDGLYAGRDRLEKSATDMAAAERRLSQIKYWTMWILGRHKSLNFCFSGLHGPGSRRSSPTT
jgi:hypothetical protein